MFWMPVSPHYFLLLFFLLNVRTYINELYVPLIQHTGSPCRQINFCCVFYELWRISSLSRPAIYDVVEEKADSEPDFQYIPEKSPQDPAQLDQHALRDSMVTLKEGLSSGAILAQFDVRRNRNQHTHSETDTLHICPNKLGFCFFFQEYSKIHSLLQVSLKSNNNFKQT